MERLTVLGSGLSTVAGMDWFLIGCGEQDVVVATRDHSTDVVDVTQVKAMPKDSPLSRVSNAHYFLGVAHQRNGNTERAKAEFQAALAANPDNDNAKKALASLK